MIASSCSCSCSWLTYCLADRQGVWVSIFGKLSVYQGRCSINAFEVKPITDFNDITLHFTECIYSHLANTTATDKASCLRLRFLFTFVAVRVGVWLFTFSQRC